MNRNMQVRFLERQCEGLSEEQKKKLEEYHMTYMPVVDIISGHEAIEACILDGGVLILPDELRIKLFRDLVGGKAYDRNTLQNSIFPQKCTNCGVIYAVPLKQELIEQLVEARQIRKR